MTFAAHYHMSAPAHDGVHPGLFRPPASPSSSTDYLSSSTFATEHSSKRKWSRSSMPRMHQTGAHGGLYDEGDVYMDAAVPPSRTYALAGQLHTPLVGSNSEDADMAMAESMGDSMGDSMYSDSDYRRALGTKRSRDEMDQDSSSGPTQLFSQPEPEQSANSSSWGSFAFATIGGVVGRVWEFCKAGAFKGFYAGGGTSYKVTSTGVSVDEAAGPGLDQTYYFQGHSQQQQNHDYMSRDRARHVQQQFPKRSHHHYSSSSNSNSNSQNSGYDDPYDSRASTPTGPAPKRRRHTESGNDLGQNWVMIREPGRDSEARTPRKMATPSRTSPRHLSQQTPLADLRMGPPSSFSTPASSDPAPLRPASRAASRPGSRMSDVNTFRSARPATSASVASFKASVPKPPTPSRIPVKANTSATLASSAPLANFEPGRRRRHTVVPSSSSDPSAWRSQGHQRAESAASVATSRATEIDASPRLDAEAKRLASRRQKEERNADARMAAFNKQLQDMIRQGREALGSTIEVDINDAGWEDTL
ncbi:uncharacterized protein TrAFT101_009727 [Trichoderma asperellum]|nr:hypothetical protein TrAFT101_009727 [Trichoderma asperellum]